jgi:hypothetical protein
MKAETFTAPGLVVTRQLDRWNGALFIAWKPSVSMAFRERKALLKFVAWPAKTPTGDRFREWLASFEQQAPEHAPDASELSPDVMATGFGPECHLDETDPNYQTRAIT